MNTCASLPKSSKCNLSCFGRNNSSLTWRNCLLINVSTDDVGVN
jgi:hypothetical protein